MLSRQLGDSPGRKALLHLLDARQYPAALTIDGFGQMPDFINSDWCCISLFAQHAAETNADNIAIGLFMDFQDVGI